MKSLLCVSVLALSWAVAVTETGAQQRAVDKSAVAYEAPKVAGVPPPLQYPSAAAIDGLEGWVKLDFMVSPEGKAYEIYATNHAGNEMFIDAARRTLEGTVFTPAKIGERTIDGSMRILYRFELGNVKPGPTPGFVHLYSRFMSELQNASQPEAAVGLQALEEADARNNYEHALLNVARYAYASKFGTPNEQMVYLTRALGESPAHPELESYLGHDALAVRHRLAQLQLRNSRFGEAMDTLELMHIRGDEESLALFREAAGQSVAFRNRDVTYPVQGRTNEHGSWFITLYRSTFYLTELTGAIEELKLRCERDYARFDFDPTAKYAVSNDAGKCTLEVIGAAGATFTLMQR